MSESLLRAAGVSKSFAGVQALDDVSFDLQPGEVHALVGENGAGKSTLIKIITGALAADSGTLTVKGHPVAHMTPALSHQLGIAAIYQQPSQFRHLSVAENIAVAREGGLGWRPIDWRQRRSFARQLLDELGAHIDVDRPVDTLTMPEQQLLEIAKALGADATSLIMDEPTASLTDAEVTRLFVTIGRLREKGVGVIYISHRLEEILGLASRVTVLRDGRVVSTLQREELPAADLPRLMVGRELSRIFPKRRVPLGETMLDVRGLSSKTAGVHDVTFSVRSGEIFGIAGLVGSGRTELAMTVFGLHQADSGEIIVDGRRELMTSPREAIDHRIAYVPEDRRRHGVIPEMSLASNISLPDLSAVSKTYLIDSRAEQELAGRFVSRLRVKTPSVDAAVESLSGGNQQKVALARWLATDPKVLILDEPTQGVDVGAKAEIHEFMGELAARGVAIVMISSELPELLGMSDRIAVMRHGRIAGELSMEESSEAAILALALGVA